MSKYESMDNESSEIRLTDANSSAATLDVAETMTTTQQGMDLVTYNEPPSVQYADPMKFTTGRKEHSVTFTNMNSAYNNTQEGANAGAPAYHVTENGNVVKAGVIVTHEDGSRTVRTDTSPLHWSDFRHPLKERHLQWYLVLAAICIVLFFPTGIPAFIFARETKKQFYEGIEHGSLDRAKSCAKKAERLMVLTGVIALLIVVLVLALFESQPVERIGTIG